MGNEEMNRYVRAQLLQALIDLVQKKPFSEITVSELAQRAGVARATFYRNYRVKEDVLRREATRLGGKWKMQWARRPEATPDEYFLSLLEFYRLNARFYRAVYLSGMTELVLDTFLKAAKIAPEQPNAVAYRKSAMAYMTYGWVIEWIRRGCQESGQELAQQIQAARASA